MDKELRFQRFIGDGQRTTPNSLATSSYRQYHAVDNSLAWRCEQAFRPILLKIFIYIPTIQLARKSYVCTSPNT